ncbi:MAG TPA: hypothetical protein PKE47_08400, partial [Verrucomicrobiota bacterium]|nr:hypothetical protein [Verrucomicrobiota bacterium]
AAMALLVLPGQLERRAELYLQLAFTVGAGLPLPRALRELALKPVSRSFSAPLRRAAERLEEATPWRKPSPGRAAGCPSSTARCLPPAKPAAGSTKPCACWPAPAATAPPACGR